MRPTVFILLASLISSQAAGQNPHEGPFTGQGLARLMEDVCSAEIAAQTAQNLRSGDLAFFEGTEELLAIEETGSPPILISRTDLMGVHDSAGLQYDIGVILLHQGFATYMGLTEQRNEDYVMSLALTRMCFLRRPPAVMIASRDPSDEGEILWLADVTNAFEVVWQRKDAPLIAALQPPLPLPQARLRGYYTGASWGDLPAWLSAARTWAPGRCGYAVRESKRSAPIRHEVTAAAEPLNPGLDRTQARLRTGLLITRAQTESDRGTPLGGPGKRERGHNAARQREPFRGSKGLAPRQPRVIHGVWITLHENHCKESRKFNSDCTICHPCR